MAKTWHLKIIVRIYFLSFKGFFLKKSVIFIMPAVLISFFFFAAGLTFFLGGSFSLVSSSETESFSILALSSLISCFSFSWRRDLCFLGRNSLRIEKAVPSLLVEWLGTRVVFSLIWSRIFERWASNLSELNLKQVTSSPSRVIDLVSKYGNDDSRFLRSTVFGSGSWIWS